MYVKIIILVSNMMKLSLWLFNNDITNLLVIYSYINKFHLYIHIHPFIHIHSFIVTIYKKLCLHLSDSLWSHCGPIFFQTSVKSREPFMVQQETCRRKYSLVYKVTWIHFSILNYVVNINVITMMTGQTNGLLLHYTMIIYKDIIVCTFISFSRFCQASGSFYFTD